MNKSFLHSLILISVFAAITSCSPLVKIAQPEITNSIALEAGSNVGQTFVANYDGLNKIAFYLEPGIQSDGNLVMHLREDAMATEDILICNLSLAQIKSPGYYGFEFTPISDSNNKYYYVFIEFEGVDRIKFGSSTGSTYINGSAYLDHTPIDSQLSFRLLYSPEQAFFGILSESLIWLKYLILGIFLFVVPGWALLNLLLPGWHSFSFGEKLGISSGISIAIYPILFLWTDLINLHLDQYYAWIPGILGVTYLVFVILRDIKFHKEKLLFASKNVLPDLTYIGIIFLIIFVRFWSIRNLDIPMWGDSYQHTMIAQLLVDHGGLFESWQPYTELNTFTYHFGFHTLAAVFHWISSTDLPTAVLYTGQIINILAMLALYPLAMRISRNKWAGVFTVLIAGLLLPLPMYYTNWGRFTQLAGQAILPAAVLLIWTLNDTDQVDWRSIVLSSIVIGGLALTHYRVIIFAVIFIFMLFILSLKKSSIKNHISKYIWTSIGAFALFLPWFINVFKGKILDIFSAQINTPADQISTFTQQYNIIGNIYNYLSPATWVTLLVVIIFGLLIKNRGITFISLWWLLIFISANPNLLQLPGAGAISNFAVFIAIYIPASVLIGSAASLLLEKSQEFVDSSTFSNLHGYLTGFLVLLVMVIGIWKIPDQLDTIRVQEHALVTKPDLNAAKWLRSKTPQSARVLVNSFFAFENSIVGSDGGWWLPVIASRSTSLPPLSYGFEDEPWPGYRDQVYKLTEDIKTKGIQHPDIVSTLLEQGYTHVYIGHRQGSVNYQGPNLLPPETLIKSPNYKLIYNQDRVFIFKIIQS